MMPTPTLTIECPEHFAAVTKFTEANGCATTFLAKLDRLKAMTPENGKCYLHKDHAPLSFMFLIERADRSRDLVGGLIYSGPTQRLDGGAPTFTVSVEPHSNEHNWSIHT